MNRFISGAPYKQYVEPERQPQLSTTTVSFINPLSRFFRQITKTVVCYPLIKYLLSPKLSTNMLDGSVPVPTNLTT